MLDNKHEVITENSDEVGCIILEKRVLEFWKNSFGRDVSALRRKVNYDRLPIVVYEKEFSNFLLIQTINLIRMN